MKLFVILSVLAVLPASAGPLGISPTASLQITTPQKASLSLGLSGVEWGSLWGPDAGFLVRLEPGLAGGKVHLGSRFAFSIALVPLMYVDLAGAVLYTWGDPWMGLRKDQTYLGAETRIGAGLVFATAGVYRHVAGSDDDPGWILSAGAGLGI
jgi:hypothetical protein